MAAQANLDETLKNHSRFVFDELAPPATENEIGQLRATLGGAERPFLELWFKWHNGCNNHPIGILPLGEMLSINESVNKRTTIQSDPLVHQSRKRDIKLLDDGAGDGFFLNLSKSPPGITTKCLRMHFQQITEQWFSFSSSLNVCMPQESLQSTNVALLNSMNQLIKNWKTNTWQPFPKAADTLMIIAI
jgi:hypothetical protein